MPQRFLSIKNYEKYQTSSGKSGRPWIKLYKSILSDPEFMKLSIHSRFLYTGLLLLADDCQNRIYNDRTYIGQRLYIPHTEVNLTPLYRAGFLYASNMSRVLSEERRVEESRGEENAALPTLTVDIKPKGKRQISDEDKPTDKHREFAKSLGVDPGPEWGKFKNYCLAHGKQYVNFEAAFRNWLANSMTMNGGKRVL